MLIRRKPSSSHSGLRRVGDALIDVKRDVDSLRSIRTAIMKLAYALTAAPGTRGYLVLVESQITEARLRAEWKSAQSVLQPEVMDRVSICIATPGGYRGIPQDPPASILRVLDKAASMSRPSSASSTPRTSGSFVTLKVLLHQWLTRREPVTTDWLVRTTGYSYPTVARAIKELGSLIERGSDRRVSLRYFPEQEWARLRATADRARSTLRFSDASGQPRSPETHLRRLEKLNPSGVAVGGVLGALHYLPALDLAGAPRLDLSVSSAGASADLAFVEALDPALKQEADQQKPATLAVHFVRHADPLFTPRMGSLAWADPLECLLDLDEARLEQQANQFLKALKATPKGE